MRRPSKIRSSSFHPVAVFAIQAGLLCVVLVVDLAAQTRAPSQILEQYRSQRTTWFSNVWPFANTLFGLLAVIEFAWSAAVMLLEKADLQSWTAALVRKVMWLGAFYALLIYGWWWIPAIVDSFEQIGQTASGTGPLSPSDVFVRGLNIAGALMDSASTSAFFTNTGVCLALVFAAAVTVLSFIAITIQFVVAMVESYIIVAAGIIFVGFGGSRWTAPYVERYIGLGVATGVKIMLLYLLIGAGMDLSLTWMDSAQAVGTAAKPAMSAFEIMGAALIFMMLCWQIPKLFAAVLGGSPALSGGDLAAAGGAVLTGAALLGTAAVTGVGAAAGATRMISAGGTGSTAGGGSGAAGLVGTPSGGAGAQTVPPPAAPQAPASGGVSASHQPAPPSASGADRPAPRTATTMNATRTLGNLRGGTGRMIPSDAAPHTTPPRMDMDHHE
jgi:type IV secretion system protein TrbL